MIEGPELRDGLGLAEGQHVSQCRLMESYSELTAYTDQQLVDMIDGARHNVSVGVQWYLDELVEEGPTGRPMRL